MTSENKNKILELYNKGYSYEQIAIECDCSESTVRNNLKKHPNFEDRNKLANSLAVKFPDRMYLYDYEKNKLSPEKIPSYSKITKIWLRCPIDNHSWLKQSWGIVRQWRKGTSGCPVCAGKVATDNNSLLSLYPKHVKKYWHYGKNGALGLYPYRVRVKSNKKAWFRCENNHEWLSTIQTITNAWQNNLNSCLMCGRKGKKKIILT
jgi:predicted DNA-binding protein YlxM (UPF0122 family)